MALTHTNAPTVELCSLTARGREDFLAQWIVDDAVFELIFVSHGDRDSEDGKAVNVVRRAVEGVDNPLEVVRTLSAALFSEYRVIGVVLVNDLDDGLLSAMIDLRHELVSTLVRDLEPVKLVQMTNHDVARLACGLHRDIDHCVHRFVRPEGVRDWQAGWPGTGRIHAWPEKRSH